MKKVIGYTTGVFDMFHIGHLNILKNARSRCDHLIVGVTTDELAFELKNRKPIIPFEERISIVKSIHFVDQAVPEKEQDKLAAWDLLRFDIIFKGSDWQGTEKWNKLEKEFQTKNVEVLYFPYTDHTSSSTLRKYLNLITQE